MWNEALPTKDGRQLILSSDPFFGVIIHDIDI